mmetsp:Transcript_18648/g.39188  ORF Transcript_18648/g.39188 Transcript_18648/m.39188 type:complete len:315 (+) Transcript_18648:43-987(+)
MEARSLLGRVFSNRIVREWFMDQSDDARFGPDARTLGKAHAHMGRVVMNGVAVPEYQALFIPVEQRGRWVLGHIFADHLHTYMSGLFRSLGLNIEAEWVRARFALNLADSRQFYCAHVLTNGSMFITEVMYSVAGIVQATSTITVPTRDPSVPPVEGLVSVTVGKTCPFCDHRDGNGCVCPPAMRRREMSQLGWMRVTSWDEFFHRMSSYYDPAPVRMDARATNVQNGKTIYSSRGFVQLFHGENANASEMKVRFLRGRGFESVSFIESLPVFSDALVEQQGSFDPNKPRRIAPAQHGEAIMLVESRLWRHVSG